jgi:hypothetical protein
LTKLTLLGLALALAWAEGPSQTSATTADDAVVVAAGDVAICSDLSGAQATAQLLEKIQGTVAVLGDLAYSNGTAKEFEDCYAPTWGRFKDRTRPAAGNHDYHTRHAEGYFAYFGPAAGEPGKGYYSYEAGAWHVVVINSNCSEVGGCEVGSPQEQWLRQDLAAHPAACTLAYWHHPRFSSGIKPSHALHPEMTPIWQALYDGGAEVVLNGHEHNYERFAPQDPTGKADPARGIRQFTVGTGGKDFDPLGNPFPNSEVRNWDTFGVLKLTLHPRSYDWEFIPVADKTFHDSGTGVCH